MSNRDIDGVAVSLLTVTLAATWTPTASPTTTTTGGGNYYFGGLPQGEYIVVDRRQNWATGGRFDTGVRIFKRSGHESSHHPGRGQQNKTDSNGSPAGPASIDGGAKWRINLTLGQEPDNDGDTNTSTAT